MASLELQRLWKLAQIDNHLVEIRRKAAALDVGQTISATIKKLEEQDLEIGGYYRSLITEAKDIELIQKGFDEKIAKFNAELYGGKVVNSREVENIQKEIVALTKQRSNSDDRLLELLDLIPPAKKAADELAAKITEAKRLLAERRKHSLVEKDAIEADFKKYTSARPGAATGISPSTLAKYENIRQRCAGIGMINATKKQTCGGCGIVLPEKTMEDLKDDKMVTCEGCRRILYWTEGVI